MKSSERLTRLEEKFDTIHGVLIALDSKMDGLDHVIRGNGTPGLAAKVDAIKTRVETIEGGRSRWRDAFFAVAGGISIGIVVFLFSQSWSNHHDQSSVSQMQQVSRSH